LTLEYIEYIGVSPITTVTASAIGPVRKSAVIRQKAINKPSINLSHHALYVAASTGNFIVAPCERRPILSRQPRETLLAGEPSNTYFPA
jgi:hypothetical protein